MNFKKIVLSLLVVSLFSSSFTFESYATNSGSSAGQQETGTGNATTNYGNGTWDVQANTGFRFTIIDGSGKPVSHILGLENTVSLDVFNSGIKKSGEFWTVCATDLAHQNKDAYAPHSIDMSAFLESIEESSHGPLYWAKPDKSENGDAIREFILKGSTSSLIKEEIGNIINNGVNTGHASVDYYLNEFYKKVFGVNGDIENSAIFSKMDEFISDSNTTNLDKLDKLVIDIRGHHSSFMSAYQQLNASDKLKSASMWNDCINHMFVNIDKNLGVYSESAYSYKGRLSKYKISDSNANEISMSLLDIFTMTSYAAESDNTKLNSNMNSDSVVTDNNSVLFKILNLTDKSGNHYFYLGEGCAKNKSEVSETLKLPSQVFKDKNYILLVENTIQGMPQEYDGKRRNYPSLVYGTAHNWAMFLQTPGWKNIYTGDSAGNHVSYINKSLVNSMVIKSELVDVLKVPDHSGKWGNNEMITKFNYGYGCHLYTALDLGEKIDLIDTGNPPSTETGSNQIILNRFFRKKNKDNTYTYEKFDTHKYNITSDSRNVLINSVSDNYSLVEYNTSETASLVPSKSIDYDDFKKKSTGSIKGTTSTQIEIKSDTKIKTINVLYEESKQTKVIKVYEENGETVKVTPPEVLTTKEYEVKKEDGYDYTENKKSDDPAKSITAWEDTDGKSGTEEKIVIDEETETIYILYQKSDVKQIKLFSNELSYTYDLRDLVKSRVLFEIYDVAGAAPGSRPSCGGHSCSDDDCSSSHRCSNDSKTLTDSIWTLSVTDSYDYNNELNFIRDYELSNTKVTRSASWSGGQKASIKPNASFLLIRDKVDDLITLYPHKNDSVKNDLTGLGINQESYTSYASRISQEDIKDKSFTRSLSTHFAYASDRDTKLSWRWIRSGRGRHTESGNYNVEAKTTVDGANKYYSNNDNIKTYYLLGQANQGSEEATDMRSDVFGTKYSYNKAYSSTSSDLKFYPYHLMLYRAKNANNSPQNVYVTSENLSTMKVYNAVQLGVYKKNPINALLSSTQWSTHARSLAFSGNTDKKSVLPGGAVLDLDMGSKGDTELGIRLWQSCLRDEQVETVQQDGFTTSLSKAKKIASNYQSEVKDVLAGYGLVQWGTEGVQTDLNGVLSSGVELHNNTSLDWDGRSYKTSNDSKYYLKHDSQGSDRANFDVLDSKVNKQIFYEISSDVDGNVILKKDNQELIRATMNQDKNTILSNPEAKLLDDNTKLITNFFSSIDRGLGDSNKYDRTNSRKYNEAFDGVGVLMTELSFSIGFSDNSGHRTTVLDTLLTSTSESKSDLYNFSDEKVRSFVFATTKTSSTAQNTDKTGYLGILQGDSTMQSITTILNDIQSFVYTKNFYTSNFNVTDLN